MDINNLFHTLPQLEVGESTHNPDYLCRDDCGVSKASAWRVVDDPHELDEAVTVSYAIDEDPDLRRCFTLNAHQALALADDLIVAADTIFGYSALEETSGT